MGQHWFTYWFGAIRRQAITWTNVEPDLFQHMASLGHSESINPYRCGYRVSLKTLMTSWNAYC